MSQYVGAHSVHISNHRSNQPSDCGSPGMVDKEMDLTSPRGSFYLQETVAHKNLADLFERQINDLGIIRRLSKSRHSLTLLRGQPTGVVSLQTHRIILLNVSASSAFPELFGKVVDAP